MNLDLEPPYFFYLVWVLASCLPGLVWYQFVRHTNILLHFCQQLATVLLGIQGLYPSIAAIPTALIILQLNLFSMYEFPSLPEMSSYASVVAFLIGFEEDLSFTMCLNSNPISGWYSAYLPIIIKAIVCWCHGSLTVRTRCLWLPIDWSSFAFEWNE